MIEKTTFSKKELQIELNKKYGIKVEKIEKINKGTANIFKIISNNEKFIVKEFQSKYSKENVLKEIKKINEKLEKDKQQTKKVDFEKIKQIEYELLKMENPSKIILEKLIKKIEFDKEQNIKIKFTFQNCANK